MSISLHTGHLLINLCVKTVWIFSFKLYNSNSHFMFLRRLTLKIFIYIFVNCCFVWFLPYTYTCKLYAAYYYLLPGYFRLIEGSKNLVSWVGPEMPRAAWSWLHALMIQKMIQKRAINDQAVVGEVQFISASYLEYLYWLGVRHRSTYANAVNLKIKTFFWRYWILVKR